MLPALYAAAVGVLLASRVREFADESDNLLGGYLIAHGWRLYADYFSNHMPLPYYLAASASLLGASRLEQYRLFTDALLVLASSGVALAFCRRLGWPVMLGWAALTVFAHTIQWGEMLHAGTCAAFGVIGAGLLFLSTPWPLRLSLREQVGLAAAVFVAVQSELLSVYPLGLLGVVYLAARVRDARRTSWGTELRRAAGLGSIVLAPHLILLLGLAATGALDAFVYDAYQFNQTYYAQFVMSGSMLGMLHDWEAQYRTHLLTSLANPLGLDACLVLGNVLAAVLTARARGPVAGGAYLLFVSLARVRNGGPYYVASYFSLALVAAWAISALGTRLRRAKPMEDASGSRAKADTRATLGATNATTGVSGQLRPTSPATSASGSRLVALAPAGLSHPGREPDALGGLQPAAGAADALGQSTKGADALRQPNEPDGVASRGPLLFLEFVGRLLALGLLGLFCVNVGLTYDFSRRPAYTAPEVPIIQLVTRPDERIFVAPYDPYLYLAAERLPASSFEFYFPWQAADPRSEGQILADLRERRPAAVVFRQDEMVNGQYRTADWGRRFASALAADYVPLDPARPVLADVFVPAERAADARARLASAGLVGS